MLWVIGFVVTLAMGAWTRILATNAGTDSALHRNGALVSFSPCPRHVDLTSDSVI
jgi:hypothetical protein